MWECSLLTQNSCSSPAKIAKLGGFLSLGTTDILGCIILCLLQQAILCIIASLDPVAASGSLPLKTHHPPAWQANMSPHIAKCLPLIKNHCYRAPVENSKTLILCNSMDCSFQAPLSRSFSRQEYWSGLLFPSPGDRLKPGIEPMSLKSPAVEGGSLTLAPPAKPSRKGQHKMAEEKL